MFKKPTVFVLGAGASWHYGYPTGEQLVQQVIRKANELAKYFDNAVLLPASVMPKYVREDILPRIQSTSGNDYTNWGNTWRAAAGNCKELVSKLKSVDPLVIDYFLGQNPEIQKLGKMLIAWVLRERETSFYDHGTNINRSNPAQAAQPARDNWIRFIVHRLIVGCSDDAGLQTNNVHFVTFNYDLSLEDTIAKGLRNNSVFTHGGTEKFISGDRCLHVYGKMRSDNSRDIVRLQPLKDPNRPQIDPQHTQSLIDGLTVISEGIRTIDPHEKSDDETLKKVRDLIANAECLYILGFGFDRNNCARIGLEPGIFKFHSGMKRKSVMFTNFGDINRINKAASRAFFGEPNSFLNATALQPNPGRHYYEKSTRDCYDALADDFDELEEY